MKGRQFRIWATESHRPSIRVLLLAAITAGLLLIMGSGYWLSEHRTINNMSRLAQETLSTLGGGLRLYVMHLMRTGVNSKALDSEIQRIRHVNPNIRHLQLFPAPDVIRQFALSAHGQPADALASRVLASAQPAVAFEEGDRIDFAYPFRADRSCQGCHAVKSGAMLGVLDISLDATRVMQHFRDAQRSILELTVAESVLLFLLFAFLLSRFVFSPLRWLQQGAEALATGSRDVMLQGASNNEIGRVIHAFNGMAARLQETMDGLDQYIREQGSQLGSMVEFSHLLGSADNADRLLEQMARTMTESVRATSCRILLLTDGDQERLSLRAYYPIRRLEYEPDLHDCGPDDCPLLFKVMREGRACVLHPDDAHSRAELDLVFFQGTQWVLCLPLNYQQERLGVVVFNEFRSMEREPVDDKKMRYAMAMGQELAVAISNIRLNGKLMTQLEDVVFAMAEAVDKKSPWTAGHSHRVAEYARGIAGELGWDEDACRDIYRAALLHDIGKIGTPGTILNKEGALSADEKAQMERHCDDGAAIVGRIRSLAPLIPAICYHHERFDGAGYPGGLAGEAIPLPARVMSVADAYDAMTSDRPYHAGLNTAEAVERLQAAAGTQFDPEVVQAFCHFLHESTASDPEGVMQSVPA